MRFDQRRDIGSDRLHSLMERLSGRPRPPDGGPSLLPPPAAHLRSGPEPPGEEDSRSAPLRALLLVLVIAALVAGGYLWMARPRPQPAAAPVSAPSQEKPSTAASPADPSAVASPAGAGRTTVVVHVLGKVKHPGVLTLPDGARVAEAIKAAGGVRPGAETGSLNLARRVVDGEQIPVGIRPPPGAAAAPGSPPGPGPPTAGQGPPGAPATPVDLNAAGAAQLDQLPGVGPVLAQRIVDYRTQHGAFRSVDQLQEVNGIGARRFAELKPLVRV